MVVVIWLFFGLFILIFAASEVSTDAAISEIPDEESGALSNTSDADGKLFVSGPSAKATGAQRHIKIIASNGTKSTKK